MLFSPDHHGGADEGDVPVPGFTGPRARRRLLDRSDGHARPAAVLPGRPRRDDARSEPDATRRAIAATTSVAPGRHHCTEHTQILMTMRLVDPYCPVKSSMVVKWMMPSTSFAGSGTDAGSHEFAGITVPTSMFSTSIDDSLDEAEVQLLYPVLGRGLLIEGGGGDPAVDVAGVAEEDVADVAVVGEHVRDRWDRDLESVVERVGIPGSPTSCHFLIGGEAPWMSKVLPVAVLPKLAWSTQAALVIPTERPSVSAPTPTKAVIRRPVARDSVRPSVIRPPETRCSRSLTHPPVGG